MTVKELIEKLKKCPEGYEVTFESSDAYGSSYDAYVDGIFINKKRDKLN